MSKYILSRLCLLLKKATKDRKAFIKSNPYSIVIIKKLSEHNWEMMVMVIMMVRVTTILMT